MANPFAVVFFGALFPQFIDPARPVMPQLLILGLTYLVVDGSILLALGVAGREIQTIIKKILLSGPVATCLNRADFLILYGNKRPRSRV